MLRKTLIFTASIAALCFVAVDSASACRFLDNLCCRCRWSCYPTYDQCYVSAPCGLPQACGPVTTGSEKIGTILLGPADKAKQTLPAAPQPQKEAPYAPSSEMPAEPATPQPATPPVADTPNEPVPAGPLVTEPRAEPPQQPAVPTEPIPTEPKAVEPIAEPPKAEEPVAEPPQTPEPETDAFGNVVPATPQTPETPTEPNVEEPKAEEPKAAEPVAEPPMQPEEPKPAEPAVPAPQEPPKTEEPPKEPAAPEKKEEADPFAKTDVKQYRLWSDASGKFQVEARFVGFVDGKVRLQKTNGRHVRIEMNLLCMADQRLIKHIETLASNW